MAARVHLRVAPAADAAEVRLPEWGQPPTDRVEHRRREGYVWMRLGRYDLAWLWWGVSDARVSPALLATRAAALRELGLHDDALELDRRASSGAQDPVIETAILVGLVADAVGSGALDPAAALDRARAAVEQLPTGPRRDRQEVRLGWVQAEMALLTGAPCQVDLPTTDGVHVTAPPHYEAGSQHHIAKGLAFRGVLDRDIGTLDVAAAVAPTGLVWGIHLARADLGAADGIDRARAAWSRIRVPPELIEVVAATPSVQRLRGP